MIIYYIKNKENGKGYVGQHKGDGDIRWKNHIKNSEKTGCLSGISAAIKKYGRDAFCYKKLVRLDPSLNRETLDNTEKYFIKLFNTYANGGHGYNLTAGGQGTKFCVVGDRTQTKKKETPIIQIGKYNINGILEGEYNSFEEALESVGGGRKVGITSRSNWHKNDNNPFTKYPKTYKGFMWKIVRAGDQLPKTVTPYSELNAKMGNLIRTDKIKSKSDNYSNEKCKITQYDIHGDLIDIYNTNNASQAVKSAVNKEEGVRGKLKRTITINSALSNNTVSAGGYAWKWYCEDGDPPKKIDPASLPEGEGLDFIKFHYTPIYKVDLSIKDSNKNKTLFDSINDIPLIDIDEKKEIYKEAVSNESIDSYKNNIENNNGIVWVFKENYIPEKITEMSEIHKIKLILKT
jgi:hypothetical protein